MTSSTNAPNIIWFTDPAGTDIDKVGGKGANLGRLANAGFPVPPGFVVDTGAYLAHIESIRTDISGALAKISYDDAEALEKAVEQIRGWIIAAGMPANIAAGITNAYAQLGDVYVAVRSSGTAEDLEGASFAGLHDTYLDIKGADDVLDAVKRDWASLWTARAVAYRKSGGFTEFPSIAVVVQTMVASEVSGVMFTGNPLNAATDEIMLNASCGLGEAVVQGITTPDEYIIWHKNFKVLEKTLGSKEVEIVRNPETGRGTVQRDADPARRDEFTLTDEAASELAEIGVGVQALYEGFPQDLEWGYADGEFFVLQARPVTGVEFAWDADVTESVQGNSEAVPYDNIWSRVFPEEMWTGAISPLMFSWRCWGLNQCHSVGVHAFLPRPGLHNSAAVEVPQGCVVLQRRSRPAAHQGVDPSPAPTKNAAQDPDEVARGSAQRAIRLGPLSQHVPQGRDRAAGHGLQLVAVPGPRLHQEHRVPRGHQAAHRGRA